MRSSELLEERAKKIDPADACLLRHGGRIKKRTKEEAYRATMFGDESVDFGQIPSWNVKRYFEDRECHICGIELHKKNDNPETARSFMTQACFIHKIKGVDRLVCGHCDRISVKVAIGPKPDCSNDAEDWHKKHCKATSMRLEDRFSEFNPDGYAEFLLNRMKRRMRPTRGWRSKKKQ